MENMTEILDLLKRGEKKGLQLLFHKFYKPLVMYAMKYVHRQDEAEDMVQEVFIKFWEKTVLSRLLLNWKLIFIRPYGIIAWTISKKMQIIALRIHLNG